MGHNARLPQLKGKNSQIVGSKDYFKALHSDSLLPFLLSDASSVLYYDDLKKAAGRIANTLSEVKDDLSRYIRVIRHIPKENRVNMSKFILGLSDICTLVGTSTGKTSDIVSILALGDYYTKPFSNASDKEIEEAAKQIQNGSFSLSRDDRIKLIEKIVDNGIDRAVGGDKIKSEFLAAIKRGSDREFFKDVQLRMQFSNKPDDFTGRCGRVICSREYIDHIEKHIFDANIDNHYTKSNGDREYLKSIKDNFTYVVEQISSDLDGNGLTHDILAEDQKRLRLAADQLSKFGVRGLSNIGTLLNPYSIPDITEKLNQLMIDSENDVPAEFRVPMSQSFLNIIDTQAKLNRTNASLDLFNPFDMTRGLASIKDISLETKRLFYFKSMVESEAKYDLKSKIGWHEDNEYRYDGQIVRYDAPGNIAFGYFGLAMGIPESVLLLGAGLYQIYTGTSALEWRSTNFDDPYDQEMIRLGCKFYRSRH